MRLLLLTLFAASTAFAQSNSVSVSIFQPQFNGGSAVIEGERVGVDLKARTGFGAGLTHRTGSWSFSVDARQLHAPASADFSPRANAGTLDLTPIAALVHYHRGPVFIGAGIADVMTGDLHSADLDAMGIHDVSVGDDVTYVIDGGFTLPLRGPVSVSIDGRYMPVSVDAKSSGRKATLKFDALTAGATLHWNF